MDEKQQRMAQAKIMSDARDNVLRRIFDIAPLAMYDSLVDMLGTHESAVEYLQSICEKR